MYNILLVEDDADIVELITDYFHCKSGGDIKVTFARDGEQGIEKVLEYHFDLLLLDIMLPYVEGFEICKQVRRDSDVPIIFMTARAQERDVMRGFALGCDDYVIKPFPLPLLYEKVLALIKRSKGLIRLPEFSLGSLSLNPNNGKVFSMNKEVLLTQKEFMILKTLFENKGKIVTRDALIKRLWGYDSDVEERIVDTHIKNLRKALMDNSKLIKTVRSRGYILEE